MPLQYTGTFFMLWANFVKINFRHVASVPVLDACWHRFVPKKALTVINIKNVPIRVTLSWQCCSGTFYV